MQLAPTRNTPVYFTVSKLPHSITKEELTYPLYRARTWRSLFVPLSRGYTFWSRSHRHMNEYNAKGVCTHGNDSRFQVSHGRGGRYDAEYAGGLATAAVDPDQ